MEEKILKAIEATKNSYSPYSGFAVGAALLMKDGNYILGANVENASYGLSNCAERSALFSAYSKGYRKNDITEIVVVSKNRFSPCGACRQVITELMNADCLVTISDLEGNYYTMKVSELLPNSFNEDDLHD